MHDKTFEQTVLDWSARDLPGHKQVLELYRELLDLRRRELIPRLHNMAGEQKEFTQLSKTAFAKRWVLGDGSELVCVSNLGSDAHSCIESPPGLILYATHTDELERHGSSHLPPWSVVWYLKA